MRLPIDTSDMSFMCAAPAKPVLDFETKQPKADANGELLFNLQLVALDEEGADVITLKVPGDPHLVQGTMLKLHGLVAFPWTMGDRSGVAFRTDRIESLGQAGGGSSPRSQPAKAEA